MFKGKWALENGEDGDWGTWVGQNGGNGLTWEWEKRGLLY